MNEQSIVTYVEITGTFTRESCMLYHVYWSAGEANRLVASLVKNATQCKEVMLTVARCGALSHLVRMTMAEHLVMRNEAIVALTLLVTMLAG